MRYFAVAVILGLASMIGATGEARAGAWCAWYDPYTYNCGFKTFEQCQENISGMGGYCQRNVYESQAARPRRVRPRD